jgi:hypothetical protein
MVAAWNHPEIGDDSASMVAIGEILHCRHGYFESTSRLEY